MPITTLLAGPTVSSLVSQLQSALSGILQAAGVTVAGADVADRAIDSATPWRRSNERPAQSSRGCSAWDGRRVTPGRHKPRAGGLGRAIHPDRGAGIAAHAYSTPRISRWQWIALAVVSGLLPACVIYRSGWSFAALPPLLLLLGLVQLAYCDLTRPAPAQDHGLRIECGRHRKRRPRGRQHDRMAPLSGCDTRSAGRLHAVFHAQPDAPQPGSGLRRRTPSGLRVRPGLGQPHGSFPGIPLRQHPGARRGPHPDRAPPSGSQVSTPLRPLYGVWRRSWSCSCGARRDDERLYGTTEL